MGVEEGGPDAVDDGIFIFQAFGLCRWIFFGHLPKPVDFLYIFVDVNIQERERGHFWS